MEATTKNTTAAMINLSTLSQYFIPFGNFIFPIIIWSSNKDKSEYVNRQGKQTINFQLSLFLYSFVLACIAIPSILVALFQDTSLTALINDENVVFEDIHFANHIGLLTFGIMAVVVFIFLKVVEFFLIIHASVKTSNGDEFKYPFTIPFLK